MNDHSIETPSQVTVPAAGTPCPAAFPASAFNLAPSTVSAVSNAAPKERTRVQRAIDHLREHGPATNEEIAKAMGLKPGAHPGSYLAVAVKDGRLDTRHGRYHLVSDKPAAMRQLQEPPPAPAAPPTSVAEPTRADVDDGCATVQIYPTDVAVIARADGSILISIDGQAVDLTPKQVHLMQAFSALLSHVGVAQ